MTEEKFAKRKNRTDLISKATATELLPLIAKYGVSFASLRYKCIKKDVVKRLAQLKVDTVIISNVQVTDDEILYMYTENGIRFISKNLGTDSSEIRERLIKEGIKFTYVENEHIGVSKKEILRQLKEKSLEKLTKSMNVLQHKIVLFTKINVKD